MIWLLVLILLALIVIVFLAVAILDRVSRVARQLGPDPDGRDVSMWYLLSETRHNVTLAANALERKSER